MKLKSLLLSSVATAVLFAGMATSVSAAVPEGVKLAPKQELVRNLGSFPDTLDPSKYSDEASFESARPIYDTLLRQDTEGNYIPCAAESWDVSEDGLTWTFNLRKGATWHDGVPVRAQDFVYSWRRLSDPNTGSPYANYLGLANVVNAYDILEGKAKPEQLGVEAKDDNTLVVHLTTPTAWFGQMTLLGILVPQREDLQKKYGDAWLQPENLVGNGPYKMTKYSINDTIAYEKWDGYWDAKNVTIDKTSFIFLKDPNAAYYKYLAGEILYTSVPKNLKEKVQKERPAEVVTANDPSSRYLAFNLDNPKLKDIRVRKALALLTDTNFIVTKILSTGTPSSIFAPTYLDDAQKATEAPYFNKDMKERRAEAVKLLKEAGYSKEKPLELTMLLSSGKTLGKLFVAMQGFWGQGSGDLVKVKSNIQEWKTFLDLYNVSNYEFTFTGWGADYNQASTFYDILTCNNNLNRTGWCSKEYDALLKAAAKERDADKRADYYAQANALIQKDIPVANLYWGQYYSLKSPALGGFNVNNKFRYVRDFYIMADKGVKQD